MASASSSVAPGLIFAAMGDTKGQVDGNKDIILNVEVAAALIDEVMQNLDGPSLHVLDKLLTGCPKTKIPIVTKKVVLSSIRRHNESLRTLRDGCDLLATNFDVVRNQQERVCRLCHFMTSATRKLHRCWQRLVILKIA